jgi:glycosyltransferase involved in cell wall biosynthesis
MKPRLPAAKKILFLDHAPIVGGAQLALIEHLRHLNADEFEAHVACGAAMPDIVQRIRDTGATVHQFEWPRLRGLTPAGAVRVARAAVRLRTLMRREHIDLVVANTSRTAYLAAIAMAASRVPLLWWIRDFDFGRPLLRALHRSARRVICVSHAIRAYYGGAEDPRFEVVYVGSGLHARLKLHDDAELLAARRQWGLQPEDVVIGYMGRLVEGKGPADLITAVEGLAPEFPHLRLLVVGTGRGQQGDVEAQLHQQVIERGLTPIVRFAGFQSDEALYYRLFDIFVLSSRYREAMPTSAIQAMMAETPVVATATGGTPEVVIDDETGLLIPPNDPRAMAAALRRLLSDAALIQRLTSEARRRVTEHHREEVVTKRVESIYSSVLGGK